MCRRVACFSNATTPVTTPAAMLVPDSCMNSLPDWPLLAQLRIRLVAASCCGAASDARKWPGATKSGFTRPSYHVGPLELYAATRSSLRVTVPL